MRKRPRRARIFGREWEIRWEKAGEDLGPEYNGRSYHEEGVIVVRRRHGSSVEKDTMLHELVHVVDVFSKVGLKEEQVTQIGNGLFCILEDNPKLGKWLVGGKKNGR